MDMLQEEEAVKNSVTITDNGDGTFSLTGQEEGAEPMPAGSLKEAMAMAGQMLQGVEGQDRASIAKQVFGGSEESGPPGELARKPVGPGMGGRY